MTSKEIVKEMLKMVTAFGLNRSELTVKRRVDDEWVTLAQLKKEDVEQVEKDLEVLDILKKYYKSNGWSNGGLIEFWGMTESQLKKVREWLER